MQRYSMRIDTRRCGYDGTALERSISHCEDQNGNWVKVSDVLQAIIDCKLPSKLLTDEQKHLVNASHTIKSQEKEIANAEARLEKLKAKLKHQQAAMNASEVGFIESL